MFDIFFKKTSIIFLGFLNSFVHCAMYSYYFFSSYRPEMKKSLWWKKYITQIQLIQFVILFVYCASSLIFVECDNPKICLWLGCVQSVIMMTMFSDFYYKAYIKKKASTWRTCSNEWQFFEVLKGKRNSLKSCNFLWIFIFIDNILNLSLNILMWMPKCSLIFIYA